MTREDRLKICKTCKNRKRDMAKGLICSLTNEVADFEVECNDYIIDEQVAEIEKKKEQKKGDLEKGKKKATFIFSFLIGLSIILIMFSHFTFKPLTENEIIKEVFRVGLELGLLVAIYNGKNWAKIIMTIFLLIGIVISIVPMIALIEASWLGWLMIILIAIYGYTIFFINGDKDFVEFYKFQQKKSKQLLTQK